MKTNGLIYLLGVRPKPRTYGYEVRVLQLPKDGRVEYAQWLHPGETPKTIAQQAVDELRRFLRPDDLALDIGAHTGDSTLPIALAVGASGCVVALEPNPFVFPVLAANAQLNREKTHILPLMFAATPADGEFVFEYSDPGFCNGGRHEGISKWRHGHTFPLAVQGRNLEAYLRTHHAHALPKLTYIKVDAEGYDYTILTTLHRMIAEYKPFIRVEVYRHTNRRQREQLFRFLLMHHYTVYRVEDEGDYQGQVVEMADLMTWRHFDMFCTPKDK